MSYRARPPSPANTNFSGISNYRSESYRPIREREVPAVPQIDSKKIARVHFDELSLFLSSHLAGGQCQSLCALGDQTLTSCTLFQRYQIQELVLERSLRGLLASNSKNYLQMSTTSLSAETPDQKVGLVTPRGKPKIVVSDYCIWIHSPSSAEQGRLPPETKPGPAKTLDITKRPIQGSSIGCVL